MPLQEAFRRGSWTSAVRCTLAAALLALCAQLAGTSTELLAEAPEQVSPRAGIVVQLAEDDVREMCVELPDEEISGFELLQASGLDLRTEESSMGVLVCRIEDSGCPDSEPCMCECEGTGDDCKYWAYNVQVAGQWEYSEVGANDRVVHAGDVDGWVWGGFTDTGGPMPPVRAFSDICGDGGSGGSVDELVDSAGAESEPSGGLPSNTMGYLVAGMVIIAIGGVWIWSRRS